MVCARVSSMKQATYQQIEDMAEHTLTKSQYDEMQQSFDIALDGSFVALSDEERELLQREVATLNKEALTAALNTLILHHPAEFHGLLREQREARGIGEQLRSEFSDTLAVVDRNPLTF